MTLKVSLLISGDSTDAQKAVDDLDRDVTRLSGTTRGAIAPTNQLAGAQRSAAASTRTAGTAAAQAGAAQGAASINARALAVAQGAVAASATAAAGALGTTATAAGILGGILTGGLSIAITALITGATLLATELFSVGDAADDAKDASIGFANAQTDIARFVDLANGKLILQNTLLRENAMQKRMEAIDKSSGRIFEIRDNVKGRVAGVADPTAKGGMLARFGGAFAGVSVQDADLQKVLKQGGGLRDVIRGIGDLARSTRPDLRALYRELVPTGAEAEELKLGIDRNRAELGLMAQRPGALENYNRVNGITPKPAPAVASRGGTGSARAGGRSQAASVAASIRELVKPTNDASQASRLLEQDLQGVIARFDPAAKAASEYNDQLAAIARLEKAGPGKEAGGISPADAERYRALAKEARDESLKRIGSVKEIKDVAEATGSAADANRDLADAAREAAQAKQQLLQSAVGALDAIIIGGENAGDVIKRLAQSIASAALEASLLGTGPIAALLKGGGNLPTGKTPPIAGTAAGGSATLVADATGKRVGSELDRIFGTNGSFGATLKNAGTGYVAGSVTGSGTLGALGGALGGSKAATKFLTGLFPKLGDLAGPLGSIAGGLIFGAIGGLLKPKAKPGGATVSNVDGAAGIGGSVGGDAAGIKAGNSLGGSVAGILNQTVERLGGTLGTFSVQIGKYKDDLRVNVNGKALGGVKGSGASGFGDDENAAVNFAAAQAIAQGAVQGVSDAVAKALRSSPDVEKAMREALKVQEIEVLIGGIGGQIEKAFKDVEATAKERVRVASQYGFDIVKIEQRNATERAKVSEDLLRGQVGSLKALVEEFERGSLFEGSAVDRMGALKGAISKSKADLEAGVEGAGDTLAGLYQQLNEASKGAFGTTGGYAADREFIVSGARAEIARANTRIVEAQAKAAVSDPALKTTNAALDENNDQNARIIGTLERIEAALPRGTPDSSRFDFSDLARV